ncbi:bifunctional tRNA (5-methylaminomethyl-2-thiouridine)(34)-methyltransferase MnmD/FAD-dependent 5-carboxymethylaminomethyl-2-thiouridine(34) oxidoreductase MnmC [Cellvibrio sp. KY-GH-1]|nr:bifunctional tRNA (5-methylaminomethyl-2-thiouridine)(34)-methyltransferase MnmD/FAD-dependent 5-carboxymethylaminomethyl-2-thiouridine(34) oxidoreductase MnmC [Cellvibrio sp. KY-GH-1]
MVCASLGRIRSVSDQQPSAQLNPDHIRYAQLEWDADGQPLSSAFGDVYFSRANGLEETRHVFLRHNQLAERWQQLKHSEKFVIAETGFGSGLNFLAAWALWLDTAPAGAQLHFVTVEKFPLSKSDLHRALALWPELKNLSQQLVDAYPCIVGEGFHRLSFMDGRIKLTLIINDAARGFAQLLATTDPLYAQYSTKVDAWFLDGFAPSKNPQMWSEDLFSRIHQLSKAGTTAATFSAASIVKKGLKFAGFRLQKVAGFGRKRDMLTAVFPDSCNDNFYPQPFYKSFSEFPLPWVINSTPVNPREKHAIIIGAGLAGCTSARALAERGWRITLLERSNNIAAEASGNPQGVLYAKLSHKQEAQAEFNLTSLQFAQSFYATRWPVIGDQTGVLQLAHDDAEKLLHTQLREKFSTATELVQFVTAKQASDLAGIPLSQDGLYFPDAGWISPVQLCEQLIDHPLIQLICACEVQNIQHDNGMWCVNSNTELHAPIVIIATARDTQAFAQTQHLPIKSIRGQISYLPATASSEPIKTVICSEGYIAPARAGFHCTGATFNLKEESRELRTQDHQTNLENLRAPLPELMDDWKNLDVSALDGRVAFRCTLPDYLPAVGPVADETATLHSFAPLRKNARASVQETGKYLPGLYINIGHGSRGLAYTPLCAEILAAHINQEPQPLASELVNALNPARFLIRDLIKNKR